jgi:hypothetical protein
MCIDTRTLSPCTSCLQDITFRDSLVIEEGVSSTAHPGSIIATFAGTLSGVGLPRSWTSCSSRATLRFLSSAETTPRSGFTMLASPGQQATCSPSVSSSVSYSVSLTPLPTNAEAFVYIEDYCDGGAPLTTVDISDFAGFAVSRTSPYPRNLNCSLVLYSGSESTAVRVVFRKLILSSYDELELRDGDDGTGSAILVASGRWWIDFMECVLLASFRRIVQALSDSMRAMKHCVFVLLCFGWMQVVVLLVVYVCPL